jgi:hypothetical protein
MFDIHVGLPQGKPQNSGDWTFIGIPTPWGHARTGRPKTSLMDLTVAIDGCIFWNNFEFNFAWKLDETWLLVGTCQCRVTLCFQRAFADLAGKTQLLRCLHRHGEHMANENTNCLVVKNGPKKTYQDLPRAGILATEMRGEPAMAGVYIYVCVCVYLFIYLIYLFIYIYLYIAWLVAKPSICSTILACRWSSGHPIRDDPFSEVCNSLVNIQKTMENHHF